LATMPVSGSQWDLGGITVEVLFKNIRTMRLVVQPPSGRVRISVPWRTPPESVRLFLLSRLDWIRKHQQRFQARGHEVSPDYLDGENHPLWGRRCVLQLAAGRPAGVAASPGLLRLTVPADADRARRAAVLEAFQRRELAQKASALAAMWEERLGTRVNRLTVRRMKTRWGSCTPATRDIRLNLELVKYPPECLDYVILHEIIHFFVPNHGPAFQARMDAALPHWRQLRRRLNAGPQDRQ